MSGGLDGPGPHERAQPTGRRTRPGTETDEETGKADQRVVLSAFVENEPGVLADVTGLFSRRQINIERIVGEPVDNDAHSRITFVVEPPHPGVEQVSNQLTKLRHVVVVEQLDLDVADRLTADVVSDE
jgi:acetolactate synthase-1/3 small subunit